MIFRQYKFLQNNYDYIYLNSVTKKQDFLSCGIKGFSEI